MNTPGVVIVGAGHAGVETADALRRAGFGDPITIIDGAAHQPYQRPPLSKDYVRQSATAEPLPLRPDTSYADNDITLRFGSQMHRIDRVEQVVHLRDGSRVPYDDLVLATGARARHLPSPGGELRGIHHLHTLDDAEQLRTAIDHATRVVVIGAGFIGLEFASAAAGRGIDVTVLDVGDRPMARVLTPEMSAVFAEAHTTAGVRLEFGTAPIEFEGTDGQVTAVVDDRGRRHAADLVVVGIGVRPNTESAEASGLATDNGIVVDEYLRTDDPHVYAIGDCAAYPNTHAGRRMRLEAVQNATDQARCVAATIAGDPTPYTAVPWFWTIQHGRKLQIAGFTDTVTETVVVGDRSAGKFSALGFANGRLVSVESVGAPADHLAARKLLAHRRR
ncbi:FAD-dependent oxidoreductase [Gordonia sp. CPCC 205515]|uniref:NAD(P)/FAD-dependent oxidoreductase n=1 Tax=Gordonia sp. CPCC 205515 TaxID=3140791 RepID=UPI003AF3C993